MTQHYAHTKSGNPNPECWQSLEDHLNGVRILAERFAEGFGSGKIAGVAAWLHDLGKVDPIFQKYLEKCGRVTENSDVRYQCKINHSEAGAAWAIEKYGVEIGKVLAFLVAGHHAGLPDAHEGPAALPGRLENGKKNLAPIRSEFVRYSKDLPALEELLPKNLKISCFNYHLWIRMLFSCLVDADWLDTERFDTPDRFAARPKFPTLEELRERFESAMAADFASRPAPKTEKERILKRARDRVQESCRREGGSEMDHGVYRLTVPTGGGKTLSSMVFALNHALRHQKDRIIYAIPYTSIIEQNAEVFAKYLGAENLVEHHSNLDAARRKQKLENEAITSDQLDLAAENWDAPVILTTNVQLFESLFSAKSSRCRKLHNIANSVIILDEVQLLPPTLLEPCISVMNELSKSFRTTFVLCTATQPALDSLGLQSAHSILSEIPSLYEDLRRVKFEIDIQNRRSWDSLAHELAALDQVLCIVNTRKDCYELYQRMQETGVSNVIHLSALMCGEHRSRVIAGIREKLRAGEPVRVISTQLVEAGVDFDFPIVYRALAGMDSLLQAAGRCNREAKKPFGTVHVFQPEKPAPVGLLQKGESTSRVLLQVEDFNLESYDAYTRYSEMFYDGANNLGKPLFEKITKNGLDRGCPNFQFRTVGEEFQMVDDGYSTGVLVPYADSPGLIERLREEGVDRSLMRKLQRYTVNLPNFMVQKLLENGSLEMLSCGVLVQNRPELYNETLGMNVFGPDPGMSFLEY